MPEGEAFEAAAEVQSGRDRHQQESETLAVLEPLSEVLLGEPVLPPKVAPPQLAES